MNKFIAIGRITHELELKTNDKNTEYLNFSLAIDKDLSSKKKQEFIDNNKPLVDYINFIAFGNQAKTISKYAKKGGRIFVEGRLQIRKYQDKEGKTKQISEIFVNNFEILDFNEIER